MVDTSLNKFNAAAAADSDVRIQGLGAIELKQSAQLLVANQR